MEQSTKKAQIDYQKELNPSQYEAVCHDSGPLLVIAGAGSGKTRTLTYRVARLVEMDVPAHEILLLTFTRKASQEMLRRASDLLDHRCANAAGGTFHSFANRWLRRFAPKIGFPSGFTIMDRTDALDLIGIIRTELKLVAEYGKFPKKETLANIFGKSTNKSVDITDIVHDEIPQFSHTIHGIEQVFSLYQTRKKELYNLDYDDLLILFNQLLSENPDIRSQLSNNYRYIMVDEYQDTNLIQAQIIYQLASENQNIMAVGDDAQSIYSFRGANFKNIMDFPQNFPNTKIIKLEENYRSTQPILSLTNQIIDRAKEKYTKKLFSNLSGKTKPQIIEARSENAQSEFIVEQINQHIKKGVPVNEIAVLFRAAYHSFDLEIELQREGLPYIKVGGFKFMESAHIKDLLAHLKLLVNPYDQISWMRILLLIEKLGPKTAQRIYQKISEKQEGLNGFLSYKPTKTIAGGIDLLKELFRALSTPNLKISEMGDLVLKYYTPVLKNNFDNYLKRLKDLEQFLAILERYSDLNQLITDMALEPPNTMLEDSFSEETEKENHITLSTIHSAKGLEWECVFIIWALDGRFPSLKAMKSAEDLEEELRLMYVAATRAKKALYFTYPSPVFDKFTGMTLYRPSRFIQKLPKGIIKKTYIDSYG